MGFSPRPSSAESIAQINAPAAAPIHGAAAFYFHSRTKIGGITRIYAIDADGTHLRAIGPSGGASPAISPDRGRLAYEVATSTNFYGPRHLVVSNIDGSRPHTITPVNVKEIAYTPAWSPDSRRLLYGRGPGGPGTGVYLINADGTRRQAIANTTEGTNPAWFPDGKRLAYILGLDPCCSAYRIGLDGRGKVPIRGPGGKHGMDVSPDGRRLVFAASAPNSTTASPRSEVVVVDLGTGRAHVLTRAVGCVLNARWSPDGTSVFYPLCKRDAKGAYQVGKSTLMQTPADGSAAPRPVFARQLDMNGLEVLPAPPAPPKAAATAPATPGASSSPGATTPATAKNSSSSRAIPITIAGVVLALLLAAVAIFARRSRTTGT
jgi:Tol biopolymer transport system component